MSEAGGQTRRRRRRGARRTARARRTTAGAADQSGRRARSTLICRHIARARARCWRGGEDRGGRGARAPVWPARLGQDGRASDPEPPRAPPDRRAQTCADMSIRGMSAEGPVQPSSRAGPSPAPRTSSARQRRGQFMAVRPSTSRVRPNARIHPVRSRGAFPARTGEKGVRGDLGGERARTRRPGGGDRGGRSSRAPPGGSAAHPHSTGRRRPTGRRTHRTQPVQPDALMRAAPRRTGLKATARHNNNAGLRPS